MKRRGFIAGLGALWVAGCNKVADSDAGAKLLSAAQDWHESAHRLLNNRKALAPEYHRSAVSPTFRGNGSTDPQNDDYPRHAAEGFSNWQLEVRGLVETPMTYSLENIRKLPQRTQVTRHDCVEGWSAIGEWTGPQLSLLLEAAKLKPEAKYIVFRCADDYKGTRYYESIDLIDAFHPQTILAHQLNGEPLPIKNGAPYRMRVERQLGYKQAKYVTAIEAVASLEGIGQGKGGYWEDVAGYQWYAGI